MLEKREVHTGGILGQSVVTMHQHIFHKLEFIREYSLPQQMYIFDHWGCSMEEPGILE